MRKHALGRRAIAALLSGVVGVAGLGATATLAGAGSGRIANADGTVWVANRGTHTIRGFDAGTGDVVATVPMSPGSQPGDLASANGKLYVAEEFGTPPAIAVVADGVVTTRIALAPGSRPHHVHATTGGGLVSFGLYGTDKVAVVETATDTLLGVWDINPATANGRAHAGVFSTNGKTLYVASDSSNEVVAIEARTGEILWRLNVPGAHELAISRNGKTAYVTRRTANRLAVVDLETHDAFTDVLTLGLPDTLRLTPNGKVLTVGLRTSPAEIAVVDAETFEYSLVRIGPLLEANTVAAHQWTSNNGRFTFAAYEGGSSPGVAVIDHGAGNDVVARLPYPGRPHGLDFES